MPDAFVGGEAKLGCRTMGGSNQMCEERWQADSAVRYGLPNPKDLQR